MDMVFVYEDKIAQDAEGNYYTGSAFSQEVFDRYLKHFDHITLLMRKADIDPNDTESLSKMNRICCDRINVVILPNPSSSIRSYLDIRIHAKFKQIVLNELKRNRAVIIRAPSSSGTIAADYCHAHMIPYLAEAVGCPWDSLWNHSLRGKVLAPGVWKGFRRTMRNADYTVYVTTEFLQRRYPTNGRSVAISDVELPPINDAVLRSRLKKIRNHSGKIKIGTAGALHVAYKGQRYMIEALAKLKEQGRTNYEYHLAGGGDSSSLKILAERLGVINQVVFDGTLRHDQMFDWFDALDVYIQPSIVEAMPRALIEAMSRGLPALGSIVGGIPELLGEESVFRRRDVNAMAIKIGKLSKKQMLSMAERNFTYAKRFQKELLEKKRIEIYSAFANEIKGKGVMNQLDAK